MQAAIVTAKQKLGAVMIPPSKLHVTLGGVLHLQEEGQLARAQAVLAEVVEKEVRPFLLLNQHNHNDCSSGGTEGAGSAAHGEQEQQEQLPPPLRFPGLGSFGSRVIFLRPCEDHQGTAAWKEVSRCVCAYIFECDGEVWWGNKRPPGLASHACSHAQTCKANRLPQLLMEKSSCDVACTHIPLSPAGWCGSASTPRV